MTNTATTKTTARKPRTIAQAEAQATANVVEFAKKHNRKVRAEAKAAQLPSPLKKAPAKKAAKKVEPKSAVERIRELRAEGESWRVLSATLNAEGITTVRGAAWSANGTSAFLLGRKHGIA